MNVFVAVTANDAKSEASTLVLKTLRVGFPNWPVVVFDNGNSEQVGALVKKQAAAAAAECVRFERRMAPGDLLLYLLKKEEQPFYLVTGDISFGWWFQWWRFPAHVPLAGRWIPALPTQGGMLAARFSPSLLYVNPTPLWDWIKLFESQWPARVPLDPIWTLFRATDWIGRLSLDTLALLSRAPHSQAFSAEQLSCFDWLAAGTGDSEFKHEVFSMMADWVYNPSRVGLLWKRQQAFLDLYSRRVYPPGVDGGGA